LVGENVAEGVELGESVAGVGRDPEVSGGVDRREVRA